MSYEVEGRNRTTVAYSEDAGESIKQVLSDRWLVPQEASPEDIIFRVS